jgi:hypothetical protein
MDEHGRGEIAFGKFLGDMFQVSANLVTAGDVIGVVGFDLDHAAVGFELPHLVAHRRQIARERFNLIEFRRREFAHLTARRAAGVADFEDALQVVELEPD